ncbi:hypothetical protein PR048_009199 [Dryococelus australis]|uniref:Cytochrome P450 n=1 Tax=Dryococelus australis TaxID=614101 RepID=A0ABQ9HZ94_9NEOP|nr:hypothetical protein PR048_009199 [Dryococelus australis]
MTASAHYMKPTPVAKTASSKAEGARKRYVHVCQVSATPARVTSWVYSEQGRRGLELPPQLTTDMLAVTLLLLAVVLVGVWRALGRRYWRLGDAIPGPRGLPLLGSALHIVVHAHDIMDYAREVRRRHGPVCRVWVGGHLLVLLTHPADVEAVLARTLSKAAPYTLLRLLFGNAVFSAEGDAWRRLRRLMNPAFSQRLVDKHLPAFDARCRAMADDLRRLPAAQPFDVAHLATACAFEMVVETSLGVHADVLGNRDVMRSFTEFKEKFYRVLLQPWLWFTSTTFLLARYKELGRPIRDFVDDVVALKLQSRFTSDGKEDNKTLEDGVENNGSFVDLMISAMDNKSEPLTLEDLRDQVLIVAVAGTDTSAFTVSCVLMLLGLHQEVQARVLREQHRIFGEEVERPTTPEDLKQMVYLEQVINETMRLYPPAPIVGRSLDQEVVVSGYTLPAGATVVVPIYLVHRDPVHFPDPDTFDPERFSADNCRGRPLCAFLPFATGRRACIGKRYAYSAMKTMLSSVVRRFQVLEHGSRRDMERLQFQLLSKMVNGHYVRLKPRQW